MFKFAIFSFFILMSTLFSNAETMIAIYGKGNSRCTDFLAAVESDDAPLGQSLTTKIGKTQLYSEKSAYLDYALGMISAFNLERSDKQNISIKNINTILEFSLRKYCNENPSNLFFTSVHIFSLNEIQK
jgi:hypothetical protein